MLGGRLQLRSLIFAFLTCFVLNPCVVGQVHHKVKKEEILDINPVIPPTPAQMPATPPKVAFAAGQLTITAPNSTLGDILREVRKETGASVDIPGNATERVIGTFGPGPARDVLASLLNGSHFNYVLLGSATNPNALDRVMLMSKPAAEQTTQQANNTAPQNPGAPPAPAQAAETMEFGNDESADSQDSADIFAGADDQSNQVQQADDQQVQPQPNPFGTLGNGVKTPDQLLQELQQRQQQQGLSAPPAGGGPNPAGPRVGMPGMPPGAPPGMPGTPPTPNQ